MKQTNEQPDYHSFVLVCWAEGGQKPPSQPIWRFRLEDPHSGERWGFVDLVEIAEFLQLKLITSME
jgi:hypothetical protein